MLKETCYRSSQAQPHELDPPQEEGLSWDSKEYGHRVRMRVSEAALIAGWLNTKAIYSFTVLEPQVQNQGVSRTTLALEALREKVFVSAKVAITKYHRLGRGWEV